MKKGCVNMERVVEIVIAVITSGVLGTVVTHLLSSRKYHAEIEALRADNQIKIDEHIKQQFMELADSYKKESDERKAEIEELQRQNKELINQVAQFQKQVGTLETEIEQLMAWVTYDMLHYQNWIEKELVKVKPDVEFPKFRKPPKFVQQYMEEHGLSTEHLLQPENNDPENNA